MENKLDLEQFEGHDPQKFKRVSASHSLFRMGIYSGPNRSLFQAAPDLLAYAKQRDAELKEARKEIEQLRARNKEAIDDLNGIIASGYYGQMMTRLAYVRRKLEDKE